MNELDLASLQQENTILTQKNAQLLQNLQTLQKQFRSAVEVTNSLDSISQKNSELQTQVRAIGNEKEDLQRRLNIALCRIQKLTDDITNEKQNNNINSLNEISLLKNKLEEEKINSSTQLTKMQTKVQNLEEQIKEKNKTIDQNNIEFDSIFKAATQHFNQIIDNYDDLVRLLLIPPQIPEVEPQIVPQPVISKKRRKIKPQNKTQKVQQQDIFDRQKVETEIREQYEGFYTQQMNEISSQNQELMNKNDRLIKENENLKTNFLKLTEENSKLKIQIQCEKNDQESKLINQSIQMNEKIKELTSQLNSSEQSNDLFKKQISPLLTKVHHFEQQNKILSKQLNKAKSANSAFQEDNEKLIHDNELMAQKLNENQTKLSQISKSLNDLQSSAKKLQSSLNEKNAENQSLKLTINGLQQSSQLQNDEIETQKEQLIKTSQMLQEETEKSAKLEISIKQVEKKCQALEESAKISHEKLLKSKEPCECDLILPLSVWSVPEMTQELVDVVEQVASNQTLKFPAKIRQVLSIVCKYYLSMNERIEKELSLKQDSEIAVHSKILDFANVLKLAFPEIGAEFDDFLENKETQQKMIDVNKESRKSQKSLMIEKDNLEKKILDLLLFLQVDSVEDAMLAIKEKNENIQNLEILSNNQMKDIATLTKRFDKLKIDFTKRISALNKEIDKQQQLFVEMTDNNELLNSKLNEANRTIEENNESFEQKSTENQVIFNAKLNEYEKQNSLLHAQINSQNLKLSKLSETNDHLQKELSKSVNTITLMKKKQNSLLDQIKQIANYKIENDKLLNAKMAAERNMLDEKLTKEADKFRVQIDELSADNDKLKQQNEALQNLTENLKGQISDLSLRLQKAALKFETFSKECEREKFVVESQHRSEILALKSNFGEKIAEKEALARKAKREVMSCVALHFCSLFDANSEMNEENFAAFVKEIKCRLADLVSCENKLRVLLQIGPQQSIVDNVAQLLLSSSRIADSV